MYNNCPTFKGAVLLAVLATPTHLFASLTAINEETSREIRRAAQRQGQENDPSPRLLRIQEGAGEAINVQQPALIIQRVQEDSQEGEPQAGGDRSLAGKEKPNESELQSSKIARLTTVVTDAAAATQELVSAAASSASQGISDICESPHVKGVSRGLGHGIADVVIKTPAAIGSTLRYTKETVIWGLQFLLSKLRPEDPQGNQEERKEEAVLHDKETLRSVPSDKTINAHFDPDKKGEEEKEKGSEPQD